MIQRAQRFLPLCLDRFPSLNFQPSTINFADQSEVSNLVNQYSTLNLPLLLTADGR